jgi:hypothetical protein
MRCAEGCAARTMSAAVAAGTVISASGSWDMI